MVRIYSAIKGITSNMRKGLVYFQQAKISLIVADRNECFLRKGTPFPMLATEYFKKERKR